MNKPSIYALSAILGIALVAAAVALYRSKDGTYVPSSSPQTTALSPARGEKNASPATGSPATASGKRVTFLKAPYHSPLPKPLPFDGPLANSLDALTASARSDPALAFSLASQLIECKTLDQAYQIVESHLKDKENDIGVENVKYLDESLPKCVGLSPKQLDSYADLLEFAALHGDRSAQASYAGLMASELSKHSLDVAWISDYKNKSMAFLQAAASDGDIDAMIRLSNAYWEGTLTDQDKQYAYALKVCVDAVAPTKTSKSSLAYFGSKLSSEEMGGVIQIANSICPQ